MDWVLPRDSNACQTSRHSVTSIGEEARVLVGAPLTSTDVTNTGALELSEDTRGNVKAGRSPRCARSARRFALRGQCEHVLGDLVAGAADRWPHGSPQIRRLHSTASEELDRRRHDAVEHASPPGVHSGRQSTVPRSQQDGHAIGHENAAARGRPDCPGVQHERIRRGHVTGLSRGHDGGVNLVHPGQMTPLLEPEQLLEPTTVAMNTLRVVPDVERQVPPVICGPFLTLGTPTLSAATRGRDGTGPQAAGGEEPTSPRAQIHLDQVRDLDGGGIAHVAAPPDSGAAQRRKSGRSIPSSSASTPIT